MIASDFRLCQSGATSAEVALSSPCINSLKQFKVELSDNEMLYDEWNTYKLWKKDSDALIRNVTPPHMWISLIVVVE